MMRVIVLCGSYFLWMIGRIHKTWKPATSADVALFAKLTGYAKTFLFSIRQIDL
jgi:hypothetical protein